VFDRSKYMNKDKCKACGSGSLKDDKCFIEDMKISEMNRCPLHDPDLVEELNDPEYLEYLDNKKE